ncbi:hypothetical protein [Spiroplasma endosymbiont of Virgichneumon dumeticola]|uniref:hypothetical protein n=1 Tax=Spiroplasma endosymbiont of Virgichneumon dumeticola TaxID=3139323 RepID=UPI0035C8ADD1
MFRRFLIVAITLPTLTTTASSLFACSWNLEPTVLMLSSYENSQYQNDSDQIIFKKLQTIYGNNHVVTLFTSQDDNQYATMLRNFLTTYNIKKVFVLNPSFQKYLPHSNDTNVYYTSNIVRVMQQFQDVRFYFFKNIIADLVKVNNNVYDIRFNSANATSPINPDFGKQLAQHFVANIQAGIANSEYSFDSDLNGHSIVKIGVINNIGIAYDQKILEQFKTEIEIINTTSRSVIYKIIEVNTHNNFVTSNVHSSDGIRAVGEIAQELYEHHGVNFIVNTNSWYNNIISHSASLIATRSTFSKTIKFIGYDVINKNDYVYDNNNYLAFSFSAGLEIIDETVKSEIDVKYKITPNLGLPESKTQTYGVNLINFY